jgi:hypothetical protein
MTGNYEFQRIRKTVQKILYESKAVLVTGCGGPQDCETSRLPHFPESQLTGSGQVTFSNTIHHA